MMKTCIKCSAVYEGRYCGACKKAIAKAYYAKAKTKILAASNKWRRDNPEKAKAIRIAEYLRNRDKHLTAQATWRKANPERIKITNSAWRAANPEKRRAAITAWHKANPHARSIHENNRRGRSVGGKISSDIRERLYTLQKGKCACCKLPLGEAYQLDHILPLALGGANIDSNIQLLRSLCNMQKHKKHPVDFMQQRGSLL